MNELFIRAKDLHYAYKEEGEPDTAVLRGLSLDINSLGPKRRPCRVKSDLSPKLGARE